MANYAQDHGPEQDAKIQGAADGASGKERRKLGGYLAEFQRQYDAAYDKAKKWT